jgi:hypothetical protein
MDGAHPRPWAWIPPLRRRRQGCSGVVKAATGVRDTSKFTYTPSLQFPFVFRNDFLLFGDARLAYLGSPDLTPSSARLDPGGGSR